MYLTAPQCPLNLPVMVSGWDLAFLEQVTSPPPSVPRLNMEGIVLVNSKKLMDCARSESPGLVRSLLSRSRMKVLRGREKCLISQNLTVPSLLAVIISVEVLEVVQARPRTVSEWEEEERLLALTPPSRVSQQHTAPD